MIKKCDKCKGEGSTECTACKQSEACVDCAGEGWTEECISTWEVPKGHEHFDELTDIKADAIKCKADHAKLCQLNPRAIPSYDQQIAATLKKLNSMASNLDDL